MLYTYDRAEIFEAPHAKKADTSVVYLGRDGVVGLAIEVEGSDRDPGTGLPYRYHVLLPMHVAKALYRELGDRIDEIAG